MREMESRCFKFWASKSCFDWLAFMSAIDEFSIKQDYTSATLHVQGLMLAGRGVGGTSGKGGVALFVFCSTKNQHLSNSVMAGDFPLKCQSAAGVARLAEREVGVIIERLMVEIPALTLHVLKFPWVNQWTLMVIEGVLHGSFEPLMWKGDRKTDVNCFAVLWGFWKRFKRLVQKKLWVSSKKVVRAPCNTWVITHGDWQDGLQWHLRTLAYWQASDTQYALVCMIAQYGNQEMTNTLKSWILLRAWLYLGVTCISHYLHTCHKSSTERLQNILEDSSRIFLVLRNCCSFIPSNSNKAVSQYWDVEPVQAMCPQWTHRHGKDWVL